MISSTAEHQHTLPGLTRLPSLPRFVEDVTFPMIGFEDQSANPGVRLPRLSSLPLFSCLNSRREDVESCPVPPLVNQNRPSSRWQTYPTSSTTEQLLPSQRVLLSPESCTVSPNKQGGGQHDRLAALINLLEDEIDGTAAATQQPSPEIREDQSFDWRVIQEGTTNPVSAPPKVQPTNVDAGPRLEFIPCTVAHPMNGSQRKFRCTFESCTKSFPTAAGLKSHTLSHTGEKPYMCTLCDKAYTTNNRLKVHMRSHTNEKPYQCEYPGCTYRTKQKCSLTPHMLRHLSPKEKEVAALVNSRTLQCPLCFRFYKNTVSLDQHSWREHGRGLQQ
ncbi:hypothetical protein BCR33DRAFT_714916 [Rhizoclosmatium globosum]|uniref:C2H2-type domain-containing protein n=1 Tax=Rhizoclosmatium globosum TaxID=329046 RepID=A0A1Y2CLG2_9FUNG|nr:hypothetical protein BCR33DRAFT_714916 [Rhizoclosmatium globosum]|eukprot:ORY47861.1 hypothetical protein BCR33DRAFT_714916 [Rhizoclosmatium globosum]